MNEHSLRTLEFTKIRQRLAQYTFFSASQALALALQPSTDRQAVAARLAETTEAARLLSVHSSASVGAARDVTDLATRAEKGGIIEPVELLDIVSTLAAGRVLRNIVSRQARELPRLARMAGKIVDAPRLEQAVVRCISKRGEILDTATPALQRIRNELKAAHDRLLRRLEDLIQSAEFRTMVQEPIITMRDGRYVIPVKAEFRGEVPGIVHDQSGSGATVFVEPMVTVDQNNRWRQLQLEERDEIERILRDLATEVSAAADILRANVAALAELDVALAKARYSAAIGGVEPQLAPADQSRPLLDLRDARHPLLVGNVVPISVRLGEEVWALVITGPNTGGKTVALKTVGLLTLMAQAGLHIPAAEGSQVRIFRGVYADIGDEQSIEQSLSTFSSHLTNIIGILKEADAESLVLLDELGAGTDPAEGSALARAILLRMLLVGATSIIATHYPELKAFAHSTPGVQNASVEFDPETLAPTYRLTIGLPGRSNALAIASRLGLDPAILSEARSMLNPDHAQTEALLTRLQDEYEAARSEREAARREREEAEQLRTSLSQDWEHIEDERARICEEARATVEAELRDVRQRLRAALAAAESASRPEILRAAAEVRALPEVLETRLAPPRPRRLTAALQPGDAVRIKSLHQSGRLLSEPMDGDVEVQLGSFRVRVPVREIEKEEAHAPADQSPFIPLPGSDRYVPPEIEVRGWRVEEVLPVLEQYLNDAYLAGLPQVRIIHGKGTGVLRQVVRERLTASPLVKSFHTAAPREGGEGVTVAVMAN